MQRLQTIYNSRDDEASRFDFSWYWQKLWHLIVSFQYSSRVGVTSAMTSWLSPRYLLLYRKRNCLCRVKVRGGVRERREKVVDIGRRAQSIDAIWGRWHEWRRNRSGRGYDGDGKAKKHPEPRILRLKVDTPTYTRAYDTSIICTVRAVRIVVYLVVVCIGAQTV